MAFTFFFRDYETLALLAENVIRETAGRANIYGCDAGCATGEEPYTAAIVFAEKMGNFSFRNLKLYATDIDPQDTFSKIIDNGIYDYGLIERIPETIQKNYFNKVDTSNYKISDKVKSAIHFEKNDLLALSPPRDDFSFIICKNVLLHFSYSQRIQVLKMFHKTLMKNGYLAMEGTQTLPPELNDYFEVISANARIYKKKDVSV